MVPRLTLIKHEAARLAVELAVLVLLGERERLYRSPRRVGEKEALAERLEGRDDELGREGQELVSAAKLQTRQQTHTLHIGPGDLALEMGVGPEEEVLRVSLSEEGGRDLEWGRRMDRSRLWVGEGGMSHCE